jgi:hypothetical protein
MTEKNRSIILNTSGQVNLKTGKSVNGAGSFILIVKELNKYLIVAKLIFCKL